MKVTFYKYSATGVSLYLIETELNIIPPMNSTVYLNNFAFKVINIALDLNKITPEYIIHVKKVKLH